MRYYGGAIEADSFDDATALMRKRIGENLRTLREMRGLSLAQVSAAAAPTSTARATSAPA